MPIFNLNRAFKDLSEKEWHKWISVHKRNVCRKKDLISLVEVCGLLKWDAERVMQRGLILGQRAFWIFRFDPGIVEMTIDGDLIVGVEVYVYPKEVFKEMGAGYRKLVD